MTMRTLEGTGRTFSYTDVAISVPASVTQRLLSMIDEWQRIFPKEPTYAMRQWGVPSMIVRFDGVLSTDDGFDAYELQSGCGWVGYAAIVNEKLRAVRDELVSHHWPKFKLISPSVDLNHPDELFWMEHVELEEAITTSDPLWVRYSAWQLPAEFQDMLIARSLNPVRTHNNKAYGSALGWWKPMSWHESSHGDALPWGEQFVLKPQYGFGSTDIMVWRPEERAGRATKTQIVRALQKNRWMYLQRFIPPMQKEVDGTMYNIILRPFFGYDPRQKRWVPMHGVWAGRPHPNLRIHGASDTISGPLFLEN